MVEEFFDALEVQNPEKREKNLLSRLAKHIQHAKENAPYFKKLFKEIEPKEITCRASLAKLPITRKSELVNLQFKGEPLGGLNAVPLQNLLHIFQSPGPTYDAEGIGTDWWGTARALFAAGFRKNDIVHNAFSYHFTPAGVMLERGAHALGCAVFPAGVGNTDLQIQAIHDIKSSAYVGTPTFLSIILKRARELGKDISSIKKACVGGEGLPNSLRQIIENHGIHCSQIYASADLGNIAFETAARDGLVVDERLLIEIVQPGTGNPVLDGQVGEVVATLFCPEYPLIRFATGDLSTVLPGESPCGRTNLRLAGWMGRADQTTKMKGMFIHPQQIAKIISLHSEIQKARLVITKNENTDTMVLNFEAHISSKKLAQDIGLSIQTICKLKGLAKWVEPGSLPNDGKVIDDQREF